MSKEKWLGIFKLMEEMGELIQVLGKLGPFPSGNHPDNNGDLVGRATLEIADVYAALDYFVAANGLDNKTIAMCRAQKLEKFRYWTLTGIRT